MLTLFNMPYPHAMFGTVAVDGYGGAGTRECASEPGLVDFVTATSSRRPHYDVDPSPSASGLLDCPRPTRLRWMNFSRCPRLSCLYEFDRQRLHRVVH